MAGKCLRSIGRVSRSGWKVFEEYRGCVEEWLESVRGLSEGDRGVVFRMNEEEGGVWILMEIALKVLRKNERHH